MQKITPSLNKTDLKLKKELLFNSSKMQPSDDTVQRILKFAATYRVQSIGKDQFVEMFLN